MSVHEGRSEPLTGRSLSGTALRHREVVTPRGDLLGTIQLTVRMHDGERLAVVRKGFFRRRRFFVSLDGATLVNGLVVVSTRPEPVLRVLPSHREVTPDHAA